MATWPVKSKTYFNAGFVVLRPDRDTYTRLMLRSLDGRKFAEQDVLNDVFRNRWFKLHKQCNWLHYRENHPGAVHL